MKIPNEDKRIECEIKDGGLKLCYSLEEKTQDGNARNKGFNTISLFDMKTGEYNFIGVAYKKDSKDRGSRVNYCPWCGKYILNCGKENERKSG